MCYLHSNRLFVIVFVFVFTTLLTAFLFTVVLLTILYLMTDNRNALWTQIITERNVLIFKCNVKFHKAQHLEEVQENFRFLNNFEFLNILNSNYRLESTCALFVQNFKV